MKIKQLMNTYLFDGSFFKYMPLYGANSSSELGTAYVLTHSGKKSASDLLLEMADTSGHLTEAGQKKIADTLITLFKDNWDRKWEVLQLEYNPLENYNMIESGQDVDKMEYGQETYQHQHGARSGSDIIGSQSGTNTQGAQNNTSEDEVSAFNSNSYQDSNKNTSNLGSRSDSWSSTNRSDSHTESAYTDTDTRTAQDDKTTRDHALTRSGNIGVTTSQQMAESELSLRTYKFYAEMFKDIDTIVALSVYEDD